MKDLTKSASKIVFILMAVAAIVGFFLGRLSEANFMLLAGGAFTFYFSNKGDAGKPADPSDVGSAQPYLGK